MKSRLTKFVLFLASATTAICGSYTLRNNIIGSNFYNAFTFQDIADPTSGRVQYVDQATALSQNLSYASDSHFILRADYSTVLSASGPGRNSFRIRSVDTYTTGAMVFDIRHMPQGCGTWPAIWTTDESIWPNGGEIDIVEGVNDHSPNQATLHTTLGCTMPSSRNQLGAATQLDCDWQIDGNAGCGVTFPTAQSYVPSFNSNGGGCIRVWFWPRNGDVPSDISSGATSINTDDWGTPPAEFPDTSCNIAEYFDAHHIIINLTFCGQLASAHFSEDGCPGSCVDYVNNNPSAFANAYFDFASLNIFQ